MGTKTKHTVKIHEESLLRIFLALVNFFNHVGCGSLASSNESAFPPEITGLILDNVRHTTTFNACRVISRAFRTICHKRPLILDDVVLIKLTADCQRDPYITKNYHGDFGALELSTGRKMAVGSSTGDPFYKSYTYRFATGSEYN